MREALHEIVENATWTLNASAEADALLPEIIKEKPRAIENCRRLLAELHEAAAQVSRVIEAVGG